MLETRRRCARPLERRVAWRRLAWVAALAWACSLCACDSDNRLGGVWRARLPAQGDRVVSPMEGFGAPGVELVVGHYGPDVAGLMRFYRSTNFEAVRDPQSPSFQCACSYLHQGRWSSGSQRLSFVLKGCLPGAGSQTDTYTLGQFQWRDDAVPLLEGTLRVEDPDSSMYGAVQQWTMERVDSVSAPDLDCQTIEDGQIGNIHNGS